MSHLRTILFLLTLAALCACGSVGTGIANPPDQDVTQAAAMVGAMFSGQGGEASESVKFINYKARPTEQCVNPDDPVCHCETVMTDETQDARATFAPRGDAGTYGSLDNSITVTTTDFCTLPDDTLGSGTGPGGKGRFATVDVISDVNATCTDNGRETTVAMKSGSSGIWRDTVEYTPEVYGSFTFGIGDDEVQLDCTMFMNSSGGVEFADCNDSEGNTISVDSEIECSFSDIAQGSAQ